MSRAPPPPAPRAGRARSIRGRPGGRPACRHGGDIARRARARVEPPPNRQSRAAAHPTSQTIVSAFSRPRAYLRGSVKFWGRVKIFLALCGATAALKNRPGSATHRGFPGTAPPAPELEPVPPAKRSLFPPPRRSQPSNNARLLRAPNCELRASSRIQGRTGREAVNRGRLWRIDPRGAGGTPQGSGPGCTGLEPSPGAA